jgi:hypothetical protein
MTTQAHYNHNQGKRERGNRFPVKQKGGSAPPLLVNPCIGQNLHPKRMAGNTLTTPA